MYAIRSYYADRACRPPLHISMAGITNTLAGTQTTGEPSIHANKAEYPRKRKDGRWQGSQVSL